MKRFLIFVSAHLFLFLLVIAYQAQAEEEEWNIVKEEKRFEIEIIDGIGFKAAKYFDIPNNNWKLDKLVPSLLEARKLCKTIDHLGS